MQQLYNLLFSWCQNEVEMLLSLFLYIVIVQAFFNLFGVLIKEVKRF